MGMSFRAFACLSSILVACGGAPPRLGEPGPGGKPTQAVVGGGTVSIQAYGSLHALMDQGMTRPVVSLATLKKDPTLVGLGSLSALRGEIAIVPGEVWVAYPGDGGAMRASELGDSDETAAFVAVSSVPEWQPLPLPEETSFDQIPDAIEKLGQSGGLDTDRPFPFLIEGSFANVAIKVVDGRAFQGQPRLSQEELDVAAAKAKYAAADGIIVGLFGNDDQPEFLHPGTRVHMHAVLRAQNQMGHVDHVDLGRGITVRIPAPVR